MSEFFLEKVFNNCTLVFYSAILGVTEYEFKKMKERQSLHCVPVSTSSYYLQLFWCC